MPPGRLDARVKWPIWTVCRSGQTQQHRTETLQDREGSLKATLGGPITCHHPVEPAMPGNSSGEIETAISSHSLYGPVPSPSGSKASRKAQRAPTDRLIRRRGYGDTKARSPLRIAQALRVRRRARARVAPPLRKRAGGRPDSLVVQRLPARPRGRTLQAVPVCRAGRLTGYHRTRRCRPLATAASGAA